MDPDWAWRHVDFLALLVNVLMWIPIVEGAGRVGRDRRLIIAKTRNFGVDGGKSEGIENNALVTLVE